MKKTAQYLYNCSGEDFKDLTYEEALLFKIEQAKKLKKELSNVHYTLRDTERLNAVIKAEKFNRDLYLEMEV